MEEPSSGLKRRYRNHHPCQILSICLGPFVGTQRRPTIDWAAPQHHPRIYVKTFTRYTQREKFNEWLTSLPDHVIDEINQERLEADKTAHFPQ